MKRLLIYTAIFFSLSACSKKHKFTLRVQHSLGAAGVTRIYILNEERLQLNTTCDFQDCAEKTVYKRSFTKTESDSIYAILKSFRLDTLKAEYENEHIMDGRFTKISFKDGFFSTHISNFSNFDTPTTDTLFRFIDKLISEKQYQFYGWGE